MSAQPSSPPPIDLAAQRVEDAQFYREILHGFLTTAATLVRLVNAQAEAAMPGVTEPTDAEPPLSTPALATAYAHITRSGRQSIMLAQTLPARAASQAATPAETGQQRAATRRHIIRTMEDAIQLQAEDKDEEESLTAELLERMDTPELDEDIANRPIADIILEIRRDLGLEFKPGVFPYRRRTPADVALLWARAEKIPAQPPAPSNPAPVRRADEADRRIRLLPPADDG